MSANIAHLHLHTQYSLLDGLNKIDKVVERASHLGMSAIAITDHGNMSGAIEFYQLAKKHNIKPIIGCELYVAKGSRFDKKPKAQGGGGNYHLTALVASKEGYVNLSKLLTLAYKEGFYFKPRVDHQLLEEHSKGLIILSGCLQSEISQALLRDDIKEAERLVDFFCKIFGERFFLEIQPHAIEDQQKVNQGLLQLAKEKGVGLVATNDCHYLDEEDHLAQEVLMCISTGKLLSDPTRLRHEGVKLHLKSREEMLRELSSFSRAEEALDNTNIIAEQCNLEFEFSKHYMPAFTPPRDISTDEYLREVAFQGLRERLFQREDKLGRKISDKEREEYESRLNFELDLIIDMGFSGYFLVVADFIVWAKENGIPVGPGRGSAAGSLVAYSLRITELDPIEHKLLFERFLNPDRVSLPDIDVDFCIYGREKVLQYVTEKYGKDKVAQIATFGTLKAKQAIKDVARVLGIPYAEADNIAKLVPAPRQGFDFSLEQSLKMEKRLKEYAQGEGKKLISLAMKVEGLTRHASTHAAGVVIANQPLSSLLPLMVDKDGNDITQFSMKYVEKVGLVKFDFLGLKTLTVIQTALDIIKQSRGIELDLKDIDLNDPKVFALLSEGRTTGVFQLESSGITEMAIKLQPTSFDDIVAILALYRPGPLDSGMATHYIERKHGREEVSYLHPLMEPILKETYGIILYQEQIMQLARELAGYTLAEADLLRRAMGKKIPQEMAKQKSRFIEGALANGISKAVAEKIFSQMETFARYGFNRSHSAAYALISYQTAYLKAHYQLEFMAALMSHETNDSDKTLKNINACRLDNIGILPPDINKSVSSFSVEQGAIRFGLAAIKGVGDKAISHIIKEREEGGNFKDLEDFLERVDLQIVNKRVIENLIKSGSFDFSGCSRREMIYNIQELMSKAQVIQKRKASNQMGLFSGSVVDSLVRKRDNLPEWPINRKLSYEREALGFYISGHPLAKYREILNVLQIPNTEKLKSMTTSGVVSVAGIITALKLKNTKKGDRYAMFALEDWLGSINVIVWPSEYVKYSQFLIQDDPVLISASVDISEERVVLIAKEIQSLLDVRDKKAKYGVLNFELGDFISAHSLHLRAIFEKYAGHCPVKAIIRDNGYEVALNLNFNKGRPVLVRPCEKLCEEVEQLFGRPVLTFR